MIVLMIRKADCIENQVVMNMILVYVGGKYKFILTAQDFFCKLHAYFMGLFRRDLFRLKGLDQMATQVRSLVDARFQRPLDRMRLCNRHISSSLSCISRISVLYAPPPFLIRVWDVSPVGSVGASKRFTL